MPREALYYLKLEKSKFPTVEDNRITKYQCCEILGNHENSKCDGCTWKNIYEIYNEKIMQYSMYTEDYYYETFHVYQKGL